MFNTDELQGEKKETPNANNEHNFGWNDGNDLQE